MHINTIKQKFDLLLLANSSKHCLLSELAKELKLSKTDLMQFIVDNPKLFKTTNGATQKKNQGLLINNVYITAEDNPDTTEWANKMKEENKKYIFITQIEYYGVVCNKINIDDSKSKDYIWRNTPEKVNEVILLLGIKPEDVYYGGIGDCYKARNIYVITKEHVEKLRKLGWTVEGYKEN